MIKLNESLLEWNNFTVFMSSHTTQSFLAKCYERMELPDAHGKSFENCFPFIYFIDHGKKYYKLASEAPSELRPVLLFYGMIQLLKACILTSDADYPDSSSVLAHGVTTRKRKKRMYEFLQDEVKVQKNGLFNHFCEKMFHVKHMDGEKFLMDSLLQLIPELNVLYQQTYRKICQHPIGTSGNEIEVKLDVLHALHMSEQRLAEFLESISGNKTELIYQNKMALGLSVAKPLSSLDCYPFTHGINGQFYLPVNRELFQLPPLNEIMIHYLILYNLSMICRYDTEWWSDLFHTFSSDEFPIIQQFLNITAIKIPYLIGNYLMDQFEKS